MEGCIEADADTGADGDSESGRGEAKVWGAECVIVATRKSRKTYVQAFCLH